MANLSVGKLPLETYWVEPTAATDGNYTKYDAHSGFAHAKWPATFTLDLTTPVKINTIRMLLWDNLGTETAAQQPYVFRAWREYRFAIQLSLDGEKYDTYYDTGDKYGADGWQIFEFEKEPLARYVRLVAKHNNVNAEFHIVTFEVHDSTPNNSFIINQRIGIWEKLSGPIEESINDQAKAAIGEVEKLKLEYGTAKKGFEEALKQITVIERTIRFNDEAEDYKKSARLWLSGVIGTILLMFIAIFGFYNCDTRMADVETSVIDSFQNKAMYSSDSLSKITFLKWSDTKENRDLIHYTIYLEFIRYYLVRLLVFSMLSVLLSIFIRNFKVQRHNYVVNKQKALSLAVALELNANVQEKDRILIAATDQAFRPIDSGYLKEENQKVEDLIIDLLKKRG
jgi:hypothetical protein